MRRFRHEDAYLAPRRSSRGGAIRQQMIEAGVLVPAEARHHPRDPRCTEGLPCLPLTGVVVPRLDSGGADG